MDNVTKIKFQYFKPLEKGTEERRAGGSVGLPRGRSAGRGGGDRSVCSSEVIVLPVVTQLFTLEPFPVGFSDFAQDHSGSC
ncbi:calmodulin binding transcription activator 1 [Cricetulus griseus]|nr:calmodulin binding transcription activator 1 [Cricetulus griseus]